MTETVRGKHEKITPSPIDPRCWFFPIAAATDTAPQPIKIAVKEFPPLVFKDYKGFCIDIANIICEKTI